MNKGVTGKVFDVRRFSTHDGEGIRTTIFLKGCPLRCVWCQNPEGLSLEAQLIYLEDQCIHCGCCIKVCKNNSIKISGNKLYINKRLTNDWEEPIDICPAACLTMDCKIYTVEELIKSILKDEVFFKNGGGVTLSGGEPLYQSDFSIRLLKGLKEAGINTTIETSFHVNREIIVKALPYLDYIYVDLKVFNRYRHKQLTGAENYKIKQNIEFILKSEKRDKVTIRTPLIPRMTANNDNVYDIAKFISDIYPDVKYELLNYNPLAKAKYSLVEKEFCFEENPKMYNDKEMNEFREISKIAGVKNLIIEG